MKSYFVPLFALITSLTTFGQGQLNFATKVGADVDAPVILNSEGEGPGPAYTAQLCLVNGLSFTPLIPVTTFRSGAAIPTAAKYVVPVDPVIVPGIPSGSPANLVMRVFPTAAGSLEAAALAGLPYAQSAPFSVILGGGLLPDANLTGLQGFSLVLIPEPRTIAIGILGTAALFLGRRSSRTS